MHGCVGNGLVGLCLILLAGAASADEPLAIGGATTEARNQSKLWHHDCSWWGVLSNGADHHLFRWTGTEWDQHGIVDGRLASRADVISSGDDLIVLMAHTLESRLYKFRYDPAARRYDPVAGFPVAIPLGAGAKRAVIAQDSTRKLWITHLVGSSVRVFWSTSADHLQWNTSGATLADSISTGDISSLVAFDGNKLGLFYSDLIGDTYHFRVHLDGAAETAWSSPELVATDSGLGEDHVNLAATPDGDVLAAFKTKTDEIFLSRRDPVAGWELPFHVADDATRPAVVYDESNDDVYVFLTRIAPDPKTLRFKRAPRADLESLTFEPSFVFVAPGTTAVNNFTSTKQNVSSESGLLGTASGGGFAYSTWLPLGDSPQTGCFYEPHAAIVASSIDGPAPLAVDFMGEATSPDGTIVSYDWDFGDGATSTEQDPTHSFADPGSYSVVLIATDSQGDTATAMVTINVTIPSAPGSILGRINFQPSGSTTPAGWVADSGNLFSMSRGYGWTQKLKNKHRGTPADVTLATYVQVENSGSPADWEFVLPNGDYEVTVVMGSPVWTATQHLSIEGVLVVDGVATSGSFVTGENHAVHVADGRLTLTVGDPGTSSKKSKICSIVISTAPPPPGEPVATATASVLSGAPPLDVDFNGTAVSPDSPIASFAWDFGDGTGSSALSPSHTYTAEGTYDVVFQAIAEDGDVATATLTIEVADAPPPSTEIALINFQPASSATPAGYSIDSGAAFSTGRGYGWSTPLPPVDRNSHLDQRRDTYVYLSNSAGSADWEYALANGDYLVTVVAGSPAFTGIHHVALEGEVVIDAVFTSKDFVEVIEHAVTVTDGRLTLTLGSAAIGPKKSKLCYVEILAGGGGGPPPPPPVPAPTVSATGSPLSGVAPLAVDFSASASSVNGAIVSWAWDFGDGNASTEQNPSHTYVSASAFTAELTVTDSVGASAMATVAVTVSAAPPPDPGDLVALINFQPAAAATAAGYDIDSGLSFDAVRGYGWDKTLPNKVRNSNPDPRLDSYVYVANTAGPATWEYALTNGTYEVKIVAGSPVWTGIHHVAIEGTTVIDAVSTKGSFVEVDSHVVTVSDGRLTVSIGDPAIGKKKTKLVYLEVRQAN